MPDLGQLVISNTTPVISLSLIGRLNILEQLYEEVVIPPAVEKEILSGGHGRAGFSEVQRAHWIRVVSLRHPEQAALLSDLDRGEAEVIALALERSADLIILDERLARRHAERLNLTLTGTLGVLLKAKQRGMVSAVKPLLDQLRQSGIRIGDAVVGEVLRLAGEDN